MAGIGDAKKNGLHLDPQMAPIPWETNLYIVHYWRGVAKGSFSEKKTTELSHEEKTGAVRSTKVEK